MRLLVGVRAADFSATTRAKLGFTDLRKNQRNCLSSLEQFGTTSEAARALCNRWMTAVGEVLARSLPHEERERKRSQVMARSISAYR